MANDFKFTDHSLTLAATSYGWLTHWSLDIGNWSFRAERGQSWVP